MKDKTEKKALLAYKQGTDSAARGKGAVARKIITLARKNGVPVHEDRNLVEVLSTIDLYEEVPTDLYKAAAEILSFVYTVSEKV